MDQVWRLLGGIVQPLGGSSRGADPSGSGGASRSGSGGGVHEPSDGVHDGSGRVGGPDGAGPHDPGGS